MFAAGPGVKFECDAQVFLKRVLVAGGGGCGSDLCAPPPEVETQGLCFPPPLPAIENTIISTQNQPAEVANAGKIYIIAMRQRYNTN